MDNFRIRPIDEYRTREIFGTGRYEVIRFEDFFPVARAGLR